MKNISFLCLCVYLLPFCSPKKQTQSVENLSRKVIDLDSGRISFTIPLGFTLTDSLSYDSEELLNRRYITKDSLKVIGVYVNRAHNLGNIELEKLRNVDNERNKVLLGSLVNEKIFDTVFAIDTFKIYALKYKVRISDKNAWHTSFNWYYKEKFSTIYIIEYLTTRELDNDILKSVCIDKLCFENN